MTPIFAVIDTNVIVSAFITHNSESATVKVVDKLFDGAIITVFNDEIIHEYIEVLSRRKFDINTNKINDFIISLQHLGLSIDRTDYDGTLPDPADRVFYEVSLTEDSYLVTGNKKHFPVTPKVVSPSEMLDILSGLTSKS